MLVSGRAFACLLSCEAGGWMRAAARIDKEDRRHYRSPFLRLAVLLVGLGGLTGAADGAKAMKRSSMATLATKPSDAPPSTASSSSPAHHARLLEV